MDLLILNLGWILLFITVAIVFGYKFLSGDPTALTAKYRTTMPIPDNIGNLKEKIQAALQNAGFKKIGKDPEADRIYATAGFTFWSFSEYIDVQIKQGSNGPELEFFSICAMPTQILDWGKNKRNAKKFLKEFNSTDNAFAQAA